MKWIYDDGGRSQYFKGTAGDCVTRAIAIGTGKDYKEIYDLVNSYSKNDESDSSARTGVKPDLVYKIMSDLGWQWVPTMYFGKGCKVHLKEDELPKDKIMILRLSKHLTTVVNGVIHDTYDCSRNSTRCVYGYFIKEAT